ncbi:MAG: carboxypeptidase regulatory-like domain-containing protein, partial [Gammaproteobacteria bacterium]|nr:carboxypeptidase regulatory-like domain-containing protein [Gammaproteobacteria bacterium]
VNDTVPVSSTGVLLRTSGIAGRVSVEGMGLGEITVTLSGAAEASTMTDEGGQYSFAGLAAGDYTVSIAVDSDAYVFESMSADVTLGDDQSAIQNFEGAHARTASVSGMVFLDEATKNNMYDEGEHPLAHAGLPVALVGPGVNEQQTGVTDATGQFSFTGLRAGPYQLVVLVNATVAAALAANDVAYGGPGEGYSIALGVGEAASQAIPFDITHTTVNFTASLRHGDEMGDALAGATVTLEGADGAMVGSGETGEDGSVTLKVRRDRTEGNMVKASVTADGYDYDEDAKTDVSWNPQMFATAASNSNDIVNLNVDATVSGATITTDYGGGDALGGWAIGVMHGENAVEGAPEMLDDDGMAAFETTVEKGDLPATFTVALVDDQDDKLDGGENYAAQPVEYTHTGLSLMGTMDAGTLEAAFTTQTLEVYVHHERDQVVGFTGNVLGGDMRDGEGTDRKVDVELRYIDGSGRSRSFADADSIGEPRNNGDGGEWVFTNVPADMNVIVQASKRDDDATIMLLDEGGHADELAAYTGTDTNGITGGHFGAMGGYSHTVSLCPLQASSPQDHGECSSFAYVSTYTVSGLVWKRGVVKKGDDFETKGTVFVPGQTVSMSPVEGKNLAGKDASATTLKDPVRSPSNEGRKADGEPLGTANLDERVEFRFSGAAAGVYELSVPDGWRAMVGGMGEEDDKFDNELNPLRGDLELDVTPATATLYGRVDGNDGFPVADVTVTANGVSATTDAHGRYIIEGIPTASHKRSGETRAMPNRIKVDASVSGNNPADSIADYMGDNTVTRHDIDLTAVGQTASVSGTVRANGTNAPIAGVEIMVGGKAPNNAATSGANRGKLVTGADGTYNAVFDAGQVGETKSVSVSKRGWTFVPDVLPAPSHPGAESTLNFTGFVNATITGRVVKPGGGPMPGVHIAAMRDGEAADTARTGVTGTFSLSVPFGSYTIEATLENHTFDPPSSVTGWAVNTAPGQTVNFGSIQAKTAGALNVRASRMRQESDEDPSNGDETQRWAATISVMYDSAAANLPEEFDMSTLTYTIQTNTGTDGAWANATATQVTAGDPAEPVPGSFTIPTPDAASGGDGEFMVRVVAAATEVTPSTPAAPFADTSATAKISAVDPSVSGVIVRRQAAADSEEADAGGNFIQASWTAVTNGNSDFRLVAHVRSAAVGNTVWVVLAGPTTGTGTERELVSAEIGDDYSTALAVAVPSGATTQTAVVTAAELRAAISIAVESVQGTADDTENGPKWKRSEPESLPARTGG